MILPAHLTFDPVEHRYAYRGEEKPSVTRVLKDMRVAPPYPPDKGKMELGRAVHRCCELIIRDRLVMLPGEERYPGTAPILWPYLDAFRQKVDEYQIEPIDAELAVYNDEEGYAGTLDLVCYIFGRKDIAIFDYKSGVPPACTALQTAAYDMALNRIMGLPARHRPRRRFALHLFTDEVEQTGRAKVTEYKDKFDYDAFLGIMAHWKWLNRNGLREATA